MSDTKATDQDAAPAENSVEESSVEAAEETDTTAPGPAPEAPPARRPSRMPMLLASLAFVLSFAAFGVVGKQYLDAREAAAAAQRDNLALDSLSGSLDASRETIAKTERELASLSGDNQALQGEVASIERQLDNRLQQYESLPGRIGNLEGTVSSLQGISTGARDAWLLAEAEYYMQIANAQLQLARNPELAGLALEFADERVLQLANPALTDVRRQIANELQSLDVMRKPDIEGITLRLASLADTVDALPLQQQVEVGETVNGEIDPELSGMDRALESLKRTMDDVVSVRRTDEKVRPLIAPESQYFLRANLALQLQAARLALLRGEQAVFEQSLADASDWLAEFYDTDSGAVEAAQKTIADIMGANFSIQPPDISGSLKLLRQYNALSDAGSAGASESPP